ncbi:hypothetical protein GDO81_028321, partial [Engystomops pustulosus]
SMQVLFPQSLQAGSITNVSALSSSYTSPSSSSLSSTHSAPSQLINSAPSSTRGSPSLPDKYRHSHDLVMLLPALRDRPSSAMYQTGTESGQRCVYPRALFQQVLGPCKPCSDPNLSVAEKGEDITHHAPHLHITWEKADNMTALSAGGNVQHSPEYYRLHHL